ncbi:hypothetical protein KAFR_0L00410 [Kazachstania africana CBS 2517]|uniref:SGTA homodimerisation domain-containing protein n=1 Tax=Kazachstania africana (strain ATCC 22294 / BCRC 22015 / CBS 2517 / CECT 1963 / NBRC 1671 / NRRL Y-8276) TaxID=1071382 RepID=H2B1Z8_KAZAF|nr:hypothetical protein KAFR_0L00410 [Kazachstania africana CBS 2517]CCF60648.1 hypothetical protein KAFR_0L00410 [Kazachstania africana CBS 2517]
MPLSNKEISTLIVDYLVKVTEKNDVSEDVKDSLNVAIDCITDSFEFERDSTSGLIKSKFYNLSLPELLEVAMENSAKENVTVNVPKDELENDEETKVKAEKLKLEGNKAMAMKDFDLAIAKYSEAISISPNNAIYYANRAAAYSSLKDFEKATEDAESAIRVDPNYSKGYSRLGFAKYALNKPEEALEAYKKVLDLEGDKATEIMKRDYETAKKRVEQSLNLEKKESTPKEESVTESAANAAAGGFPDMSSMLGGGLNGLLNNPQLMQAAQQMMSDPNAMSKIQSMMQNPSIRQMAENFQNGNTPDFSQLMNDPNIKDMAKNFFGGNNQQQ